MAYEIKMVKLVSGDTVIGNYDDETKSLKDIAAVQTIPVGGSGVQIAILPFGFPFEDEIGGEISSDKILYEYTKVPEELKNKYLEAKSNIKITSNLEGLTPPSGSNQSGGGLIL
ncbi:hypothetical protein FHQ18_03290 [Deferribacter autotrophicus]|uniref:Uncharacterized protein n=1 Tax=Deferribacter autotrophicus TaxID=500465 RepID=A0A5A8F7H3_9BACT|nr:hypothetical protein [Deferribacter autotrophicus]KAA0258988.1 hypothetical protein FHQ18_03290 [Deferribacter autotrophicus]